jgi:hypothetical protein
MDAAVIRKGLISALAVAVLVGALPSAAQAQACLGSPGGPGQLSLSGTVGFPENATSYGAAALYNARGPIAVFGSFTLTNPDHAGLKNITTFGGGAALDLSEASVRLAEGLSVCPNVSASYSRLNFGLLEVDASTFSVPLGLAFGSTLALGESSTTLTPWVNPQFLYSRVSVKAAGDSESDSDTYVGVVGGATVGFGPFFVGGSVSKLFEEGMKAVFGVQGGFIF